MKRTTSRDYKKNPLNFKKPPSSIYKGTYIERAYRKGDRPYFKAQARDLGMRMVTLGRFDSDVEAAMAYDRFIVALLGRKKALSGHILNFPEAI